MRVRALIAFVLLALTTHASERGLPLVRQYAPEESHAGAQNFAVAQDGHGVMWFGNLQGALSYDGAWWNVIELPNRSAVFALASDSAGRIIAGGAGVIGVIENNRFRAFTTDRPIGDVSAICRQGDGFVAITDRYTLTGTAASQRIGVAPGVLTSCRKVNIPDATPPDLAGDVNASFVDRDGALWLAAVDGTIVQMDLSSPLTVWDARLGIRGGARQMFRWNNRVYFVTAHGFFAVDKEHAPARHLIGDGPAWFMLEVPDGALVSTSNGIFLLDNHEHATLIGGTDRTGGYGMIRPSFDPDHIYFGCRTGLGILRRDGNTWRFERMVDGAPPYVRELVEQDGAIWAGTTFNGVLRIDGDRLTRFEDGETQLAMIDGRLGFIINVGKHYMRVDGQRLVHDPRIERLHMPGDYFHLVQDARGDLWANTIPPRVFHRTAAGDWSLDGIPVPGIAVTDIQGMRAEPDGVIWFGTARGMFRYDANANARPHAQPPPLIHRVEHLAKSRRMRVEFAPVSYHSGVTYQYRLDPVDADWSPWSSEPFVDFTNLFGGDYTLRVRARSPEGAVSAETRYGFEVQPPWYASKASLVLWALTLAALIMLIVRIRTRALHRHAEHLRERIAARTRELDEKNELLLQANARLERLSFFDELTGIANRRYFQRLIGEDWQSAMRDRTSLALIMIDLDHFKDLNDTRGHRAGDDSLRRVGELLGATIRRSGDVAARYGGEEFAVLLAATGEAEAVQIAERLRIGIAQLAIPYDESGTRFLTASCGVAALTPSARAVPDMLIEQADQALYAAKSAGRNCVMTCESLTSQQK